MDMTTQDDIRAWLEQSKTLEKKATHMIVATDTWDYEDYPVFVHEDENIHAVVASYSGPNMQKVMEVYRLDMDWETQINQTRSFNY